jgi:hypothetical protein
MKNRVTFALALLGLIALLGCSHTCSDGMSGSGVQLGPVGFSQSRYHPCDDECCRAEDPTRCGCSSACPCWRKHQ